MILPPVTNLLVAFRWQETAKKFARYSHLTILEREDLINQTLNLIGEVKEMIVNKPYYHPVAEEVKSLAVAEVKPPSNTSVAPVTLKLDDPVTLLKAISLRQGELLKKLQIVTIRDLLFYYPRDHIDYGRQVNIKDLVAGETVTIVGKIKKCDCFSSPKNKKLTIFSLIIIDRTGEVKISRFFAGNFYSNRGWQEKNEATISP